MILKRIGQVIDIASSTWNNIRRKNQPQKVINENQGTVTDGQTYRQKTIEKIQFKGKNINYIVNNYIYNLKDKK